MNCEKCEKTPWYGELRMQSFPTSDLGLPHDVRRQGSCEGQRFPLVVKWVSEHKRLRQIRVHHLRKHWKQRLLRVLCLPALPSMFSHFFITSYVLFGNVGVFWGLFKDPSKNWGFSISQVFDDLRTAHEKTGVCTSPDGRYIVTGTSLSKNALGLLLKTCRLQLLI